MLMLKSLDSWCLELLILGLLVARALGQDIQVVLLEEAQVLAGLGELTLLHTLTDVPVDEGALGVHEVELGDQALAEHAADSDVVRDHDHVTRGVGDVVTLDADRGLVVEANLETGGAPVDEGDLVVGLDPLGDLVRLLGADVTTVVDGDCHVLVLGDIEVGVLDEERGRVEGVSVMSWTVLDSKLLEPLASESTGAMEEVMKWRRGNGTRLVWNSFMSTFSPPSKRSEAVMEDTALAMIRLTLL